MRDQIFHTNSVHKTPRIRRLVRCSFWYFAAALYLSSAALAQQPDRGFRSANSYAASGLDAVNMANGNLILNLPLASLPSGRGGSPGYSVNLQYNSKLWESNESIRDNGNPDENGNTKYSVTKLSLSDSGGWRLTSSYNLKITDRLAFEAPDPCWRGDPVARLKFRWKTEIEMPDGSIKLFYPRISYGAQQIMSDDGYAAVDTTGRYYQVVQTTHPVTGNCMIVDSYPQLTTSGMTYITMDGSQLRLFIPYQSANWKLYFPDGRMVETAPPDDPTVTQRITDRNGNVIENRPDGICDQVGRCIVFSTNTNHDTIVSVKGVGGETVSTRIEWGTRWIQKTYRITTAQNAPYFLVFETVYTGTQTVKKIEFPAQLGQQEMTFDYFGSETPPGQGVETEEWGELKSVTLPTGAQTHFQYGQAGDTAAEVLGRSTANKKLEYTDQYPGENPVDRTDTWLYNASNWGGDVTSPDGSFSAEGKHYNINLALWTNGLVYVNSNPDNLVERIWAHNIPFTIPGNGPSPPGNFVGVGSANAYVKTELTTLRNANGSASASSPTAIKDYKYDKNGNVLEVKEYDFVTYGSITRLGGVVTGLPALTLKRKTVNRYYNQAADAESSTSNSNSYSDASSPKLKNVIRSTEIQDGSGTPVSRSEFFYDDPNNRGNLIEARVLDSTKGVYSNPLATTNSISTFSAYDQYGNVVETTDANGVKTTFTFGDVAGPNGNVTGLYPTKTEIASNYASVKRTSSAVYDLYSGLVTSATDVDNNVTTMTEYDALGRPIKVRSSAGTPLESWTRTEYDDIARRIVVRSDIETLGDGRSVATQFFDQLGRVRLSKTLEDAATQSATNETDGIKVETRYVYNDPTPSNPDDPNLNRGTYALTSNPFRSATASLATIEPTMGWTRSNAWNTGRHQEVETFSGASQPAPWGSNNSSTGVVTTEVDANATTVTDQAGKKRRSVSDAFGQLIRADEPNANGELGSILAPAQATNYFHNTLGKLVRVQQGVQNRYFLYDSLGRLRRVRQPEQDVNISLNTVANPDNNSWTAGFTYDNNGNLRTSVDAKNITITSTFDVLSRQLTRSYSDSTTAAVSFTYDDANVPFSKGKLTRVSSSVSEMRYVAYDVAGRLIASEQKTDGQAYPSSSKYDLAGTITEQTYPSGRVLKNFLETDGDLSSIASKIAGGPFKNYAASFSYAATGVIKQLQLGNGLWESAQLNSRNQVTELNLGNSPTGGGLWRLSYAYGELDSNTNVDTTKNTGNIARQTIGLSGLSNPFVQTYKYDQLWRIREAKETNNGGQTWIQTFDYDQYGNRTAFAQNIGGPQLQINNLTLPQIDPDTNRFESEQGYSYDPVGNLIADPQGREFVFNGDNKQVQVRDAQDNLIGEYLYDGGGKRVKKITATETTVFVYDGTGKLIAELSTAAPPQNPIVNYTATDQLGSPRVLTNSRGQIVSRRDFMPFGEELAPDATYRTANLKYGVADDVRQKFTGYERDAETDLDFAEARYYNDSHGRFTAVDPLLASGKSDNPQTFNRYVYTMNRPLVLTDPTGLQCGKEPEDQEEEVIVDDTARTVVESNTVAVSHERERNLGVQVAMVINAGHYQEQKILKAAEFNKRFEVTKAAIKDLAESFDPTVTVSGSVTGPSGSVAVSLVSPARLAEAQLLSVVDTQSLIVTNRLDTEASVNTVLANADVEYQTNGVAREEINRSLEASASKAVRMHQKAVGNRPKR